MHPLSPFFAVIIIAIAFATAYLIMQRYKTSISGNRFAAVDGMRGFLGISVFIHHGTVWYFYLQTGRWTPPTSNLYNQFGETAVSLFFMITSFLFISKLISVGKRKFEWRNFFVSRIFRLAPMYYVSLLIITCLAFAANNWELKSGVLPLLKSLTSWTSFAISGDPLINDYALTGKINAGVIWSLPYEWLFYFALPVIGLFILKSRPNYLFLALSIVFIAWFMWVHGNIRPYALSFIAGGIAPVLSRHAKLVRIAQHPITTGVILLLICCIGFFNSAYHSICLLITAIIFNAIAMGNSLFGLLRNATLKFLGEICYSTYLLHGILLFSIFYFGMGLTQVRNLNPITYCLIIFLMTPLVVLASFIGFKYVEKPFIEKAKKLVRKWSHQPTNREKLAISEVEIHP